MPVSDQLSGARPVDLLYARRSSSDGALLGAHVSGETRLTLKANPGVAGYVVGDRIRFPKSGSILSVDVLEPGSGYTSVPDVYFFGGNGTGATATAVVSGGVVTGVTVTRGGTGYTALPNVIFVGGSTKIVIATPTVVSGVVTAITVTQGGTGYPSAPTVVLLGSPGTGATATATVVSGVVTAITVTQGGAGYTNAAVVGFIPNGPGSDARASAVISSEALNTISSIDPAQNVLVVDPGLQEANDGGTIYFDPMFGSDAILQLPKKNYSEVDLYCQFDLPQKRNNRSFYSGYCKGKYVRGTAHYVTQTNYGYWYSTASSPPFEFRMGTIGGVASPQNNEFFLIFDPDLAQISFSPINPGAVSVFYPRIFQLVVSGG